MFSLVGGDLESIALVPESEASRVGRGSGVQLNFDGRFGLCPAGGSEPVSGRTGWRERRRQLDGVSLGRQDDRGEESSLRTVGQQLFPRRSRLQAAGRNCVLRRQI